MPTKGAYKNRIELLQGTLDMLILQTLQWGLQHGHGIGQAIRANSGELLQVETGSLYPALRRLEDSGCISSKWEATASGRDMRFYRLTPKGRKQLSIEESHWQELADAMARMLRAVRNT